MLSSAVRSNAMTVCAHDVTLLHFSEESFEANLRNRRRDLELLALAWSMVEVQGNWIFGVAAISTPALKLDRL
jgi:hypothetical protein